jgi:hypothetical protein
MQDKETQAAEDRLHHVNSMSERPSAFGSAVVARSAVSAPPRRILLRMDILKRAQTILHEGDLELGCLIRRAWVRMPSDLASAAEIPAPAAAAAIERLSRAGVIRLRDDPGVGRYYEVPEHAIFLVAGQCA